MIANITYNEGAKQIDVPANENNFYKAVSEIIATVNIPNTVTIKAESGNAKYQIIKRSGTMFVREVQNNIVLPTGCYPKTYLTCINAEHNNYKFYQLEQQNKEVVATYGRIGAKPGEKYGERTYSYPSRMYWIKYAEKIAKGYIDKSNIYLVESTDKPKNTTNEVVSKKSFNPSNYLYNKLYACAKHMINKTCVNNNISPKMVKESKRILKLMYKRKTVKGFNKQLLELLQVSPRKVQQVSSLLAKTTNDFAKIIRREEDLIAAMEVLAINNKNNNTFNATKNLFDENDIEIYIATDKQKEQVLSHLNDQLKSKVKNIFRVINKSHKEKFNKYLSDNKITKIKQLWHGSRNENWLSIILNGLQLHPNATITGKMFGDGIYFASSSQKSWGYTSYNGSCWANGSADFAFMGLYATAYGIPLDVYNANRYNQNILKNNNKNCVHAHAGQVLRNDEIIYYNEDAMVLNYIVEFA